MTNYKMKNRKYIMMTSKEEFPLSELSITLGDSSMHKVNGKHISEFIEKALGYEFHLHCGITNSDVHADKCINITREIYGTFNKPKYSFDNNSQGLKRISAKDFLQKYVIPWSLNPATNGKPYKTIKKGSHIVILRYDGLNPSAIIKNHFAPGYIYKQSEESHHLIVNKTLFGTFEDSIKWLEISSKSLGVNWRYATKEEAERYEKEGVCRACEVPYEEFVVLTNDIPAEKIFDITQNFKDKGILPIDPFKYSDKFLIVAEKGNHFVYYTSSTEPPFRPTYKGTVFYDEYITNLINTNNSKTIKDEVHRENTGVSRLKSNKRGQILSRRSKDSITSRYPRNKASNLPKRKTTRRVEGKKRL